MQLATVISTSPLRVRRDGDAVDVSVKPTDVTLVADDRVLTVALDNLVYVVVKVL